MRALSVFIGLLVVSVVSADPCNVAYGVKLGTVSTGSLSEMSGLAVSRKNPGVIWTMQDSDQPNEVYALSEAGSLLLTVNLDGHAMVDWEDIAIYNDNGRHYIYISDTGNNIEQINREVLKVYRFEEPSVGAFRKERATVRIPQDKIETFTFNYGPGYSYPNYPDCEALAIDPKNGDMYFFTKHWHHSISEVFMYPASRQSQNSNFQLELLGTLPVTQVTGADITPEGHKLALSNYEGGGGGGYAWERPSGTPWADYFRSNPQPCKFSVAPQDQRESMAASDEGWFTTSEGRNQDIWFYAFN